MCDSSLNENVRLYSQKPAIGPYVEPNKYKSLSAVDGVSQLPPLCFAHCPVFQNKNKIKNQAVKAQKVEPLRILPVFQSVFCFRFLRPRSFMFFIYFLHVLHVPPIITSANVKDLLTNVALC